MSYKKHLILIGISSLTFSTYANVETGVITGVSLPGNGNINLHLGGHIAQNFSTPITNIRLGSSAVVKQPVNQNFGQHEIDAESYIALPIKVGNNGHVYAGPGLHYTKKFGNHGILSNTESPELTSRAIIGYSGQDLFLEASFNQEKSHFLAGVRVYI